MPREKVSTILSSETSNRLRKNFHEEREKKRCKISISGGFDFTYLSKIYGLNSKQWRSNHWNSVCKRENCTHWQCFDFFRIQQKCHK